MIFQNEPFFFSLDITIPILIALHSCYVNAKDIEEDVVDNYIFDLG